MTTAPVNEQRHETRVSAAPRMLGQRRTLFYAICTCGWVGQSRATHDRASHEGRSHEDFPTTSST